MSSTKNGIAVLFAVVLSGAPVHGDAGNPLLGRWKIDEEASGAAAAGAVMSGADRMRFRDDTVEAGAKSFKVEYVIESGRVTVNYLDQGRGQIIRMVDDDTIRMELPMDEALVYKRCGTANGLLGGWVADGDRSDSAGIVPMEQVSRLTFADDEMQAELRRGDAPPPVGVSYEVDCDVVNVKNAANGQVQRYRVLDADHVEALADAGVRAPKLVLKRLP